MDAKTVKTEIYYPENLPEDLMESLRNAPEGFCRRNNHIYLSVNGIVICCPDDQNGQEMISSIILNNGRSRSLPRNSKEVFERVLNDPFFTPDSNLLKKTGTKPDLQRCVTVFQALAVPKTDFYSAFVSIAPVEKDDIIIQTDYQTVALIKCICQDQADELTEYTHAVLGSMETEGITGIRAGIGSVVEDIVSLRTSFQEGRKALSLGMKYHKNDQVYIYTKQILERIVDSIPPDRKNEIRQIITSKDKGGLLSDEMMETVRVFFRNDLNLTAASRQLFIHRNTLNYRLDKIKKEYGLDLRSFHDAVIFRIISEIQDEG